MTEMTIETLLARVEQLRRRWRWMRWFQVVLAVMLVIAGFLDFDVNEDSKHAFPFQSLFFLSALGAGLLGATLGQWNGSKELKLLLALRKHHESRERET